MQKITSLKGKTKRKSGLVDLGEGIVLPIRTLSLTEDKDIKIDENMSIPRKVRPATIEEKETLAKYDPGYNSKTYPMICEYDTTSDEYIDRFDRKEKLQKILNVVKYIDMDYTIDENGTTLWEDLGLSKGDWEGACAYFGDILCLTEADLSEIYLQVKKIQKDSVFIQLDKLSKLSNKYTPFQILSLLEKINIDENLEVNYATKVLEHNIEESKKNE